MADVHCSTCNEPYDAYHMRWDEVYELGLNDYDLKYWKISQDHPKILDESVPTTPDLTFRKYFEAIGWKFGNTVFNIKHCPCCPKDAKIDESKDAVISELEDMLDGDQDGFVSMVEDMEYFDVFPKDE